MGSRGLCFRVWGSQSARGVLGQTVPPASFLATCIVLMAAWSVEGHKVEYKVQDETCSKRGSRRTVARAQRMLSTTIPAPLHSIQGAWHALTDGEVVPGLRSGSQRCSSTSTTCPEAGKPSFQSSRQAPTLEAAAHHLASLCAPFGAALSPSSLRIFPAPWTTAWSVSQVPPCRMLLPFRACPTARARAWLCLRARAGFSHSPRRFAQSAGECAVDDRVCLRSLPYARTTCWGCGPANRKGPAQ